MKEEWGPAQSRILFTTYLLTTILSTSARTRWHRHLPESPAAPPIPLPCRTHPTLVPSCPALQVLAAHRILSAPVVVGGTCAPTEGSSGSGPIDRAPDVAGFIDIRDLLSSFLHGGPAAARCCSTLLQAAPACRVQTASAALREPEHRALRRLAPDRSPTPR